MSSNRIEIKEKIAEVYIEQFKKELNILERTMLLPIYSKMKKIIISSQKIEEIEKIGDIEDLGFWRNIIGVFPYLSNRVLDYLKDKTIELSTAETKGKLESLYNSIVKGETSGDEEKTREEMSSEERTRTKMSSEERTMAKTDGDEEKTRVETSGEKEETRVETSGDREGTGVKYNGEYTVTSEGKNTSGADTVDTTDKEISPIGGAAASAATMEVGTLEGLYRSKQKLSAEIINIAEDGNKYLHSKEVLEKSAEQLEHMAKNPKLDSATKELFEKYSKIYRDAAKDMDPEMIRILQEFDSLENLGITMAGISKMKLDGKFLKSLGNLSDSDLEKLFKTINSGAEDNVIKDLFYEMTKQKLPDEVLKQMKNAKYLEQFKIFTKTLSKVEYLRYFRVCRALKSITLLDLVFAGIDVYFLIDTLNEAKIIEKTNEIRAKYKRQKGWTEFGIGAAGTISMAVIIGIGSGPVGRLCLGVGAVSVLLYQGATYYFEQKDYYSQNFLDYIKQEREKVKKSIYTHIKGENRHEEDGENSARRALFMWEGLYDINSELSSEEMISLLNYQQYAKHIESPKYYKSLDGNQQNIFKSAYNKMEKIIKIKMEYIEKLKQSGDPRVTTNIKFSDIGNISAEATTYYHMKNRRIGYMKNQNYGDNIEDYKSKFESKLKRENIKAYEKLTNLYSYGEAQFWMLYDVMRSFKNNKQNEINDNPTCKRNIEYIINFGEYKKIGKSIEDRYYLCTDEGGLQAHNYSVFDADLRRGETVAYNIDNIDKICNYNEKEAIIYLQYSSISNPKEHIHNSSSFQNIIYEIARKIYGYNGENDMRLLMEFYSEEEKDEHGFYVDETGKRYISMTGRDVPMDSQAILDLDDAEITSTNIDSKISDIFSPYYSISSGYDSYSGNNNIEIDTGVNTCNNELTEEIVNEIHSIAKGVLSHKLPEKREQIEKEIENFVKTQSRTIPSDGSMGYVYLPQHIVEKSIYAGIGDVSKFLYKYDKNSDNIVLLSNENNVGKCDFKYITVESEVVGKSIELGSDIKLLVDKVDKLTEKIDNLIDTHSNLNLLSSLQLKQDELDIPTGIRRIIGDKIEEWINIKNSFEYCGDNAKILILSQISNFYDYFSNLYIGILSTLSNMSGGNDLDEIGYRKQIFEISNEMSPVSMFKIDGENVDINIPINDKIKNEFVSTILSLKYDTSEETLKDKTISQLLIDNDNNNDIIGYYFVQEALIICLENFLIKEHGISQGSGRYNDDEVRRDTYMKLAELCKKPDLKTLFNKGYRSTEFKVLRGGPSIRKITRQEQNIHVNGQVLLDEIIETSQNDLKGGLDWREERQGIEFERNESESKPDGSIVVGNLVSRGQKTKIKYSNNQIMIDHISTKFNDITEGLRTANLINFLINDANNHPRGSKKEGSRYNINGYGTYRCYKWSGYELERDVDFGHNTNILSADTVKNNFPSIAKDEQFMKELNQLIFGVYTS